MPSPFPGMDPYLEDPALWPDVHARLIAQVAEALAPKLRPRYVARVELRTYLVEPDDPASELYLIPDARILERNARASTGGEAHEAGGGVAVAEPAAAMAIEVTGQVRSAARHRYLEIREPRSRQVITVIEIVSPANKVTGSAGRRSFRDKREEIGASDASWFEIDLLRQGTRTINVPGLAKSPYLVYVDRTAPASPSSELHEPGDRRQFVWPIQLRKPLPVVSVPLRPEDQDVTLNLQAVLDATYDRAAYDLEFDYSAPPASALNDADAQWADALLREKGLRV